MAATVNLKPEGELTVGALSVAIVYSIFSLNVPNLADVRADQPNKNTYKSTNTATYTAAAVVAGLALLTKSPTVLVVGGTMTLFETWKYHCANLGAGSSKDNQSAN
jgi:hypothetical protein